MCCVCVRVCVWGGGFTDVCMYVSMTKIWPFTALGFFVYTNIKSPVCARSLICFKIFRNKGKTFYKTAILPIFLHGGLSISLKHDDILCLWLSYG